MHKTFLSKAVIALLVLLGNVVPIAAQVTVGSGNAPAPRMALQLKETEEIDPELPNSSRGFGLPRYELVSFTCLFDKANAADSTLVTYDQDYKLAHAGMMVYNVATDEVKKIVPGLYVWDGGRWRYVPMYNNSGDVEGEVVPPIVDPNIPTDPDSDEASRLPNSYIVGKGRTVKIPVIKPYYVWKNYPGFITSINYTNKNVHPQANFRVSLVWEDNQGLVSSLALEPNANQTYLSFISATVAPDLEGNALIALEVFDGSSWTIMWTWHLWATNYNPVVSDPESLVPGRNDVGNGTYVYQYTSAYPGNSTNIFMDRNLGATYGDSDHAFSSMGLVYQWGRSVPQLGANATNSLTLKTVYDAAGAPVTTNTGSANSLTQLLPNPTTFIISYNPAAFPNIAWNESANSNKKGVMDPCPKGWRVPRRGAYYGIPSQNLVSVGFDWGNALIGYYPAAGFRISNTGVLSAVGTGGRYWLADPSTTTSGQAIRFIHQSASVTDSITDDKSAGQSVRCVKE